MKAVNCESVCRQIEEADLGSQPDSAVQEHLRRCNTCQRFYEERVKLRHMVASLETVTAPADFDFKLRARLRNEQPGHARFAVGGLTFGFRSITLAVLVLVLGAAFLLRGLRTQTQNPTDNLAGSSPVNVTSPTEQETLANNPRTVALAGNAATGVKDKNPVGPQRTQKTTRRPRQTAARMDRTTSKDFSSLPAPVVKREDSVANAAVFPIDASYDSLKLSLDDSSGVSRTISLPRVSFGFQRVLAGEPSSMLKTSTKGIW
jgi:hypothetical protein